MTDYLAKLEELKLPGDRSTHKTKRRNHETYPEGWRPGFDVDSEVGGYITTEAYEPGLEPDNEAILVEFGYDPALWTVVSVRHGKWQTYDERWLETKRVFIEPQKRTKTVRFDAEQVMARILTWKPRKPSSKLSEASFFALSGDTQFGKIENGGTEAILDQYMKELSRTLYRQKKIKAATVVLPWLGDCIEGNQSQGGRVKGRIDLSLTQQIRILRRIIMWQIKQFTPTADKIIIPVVPGNHDDVDRQILTSMTDSWAIEAISAVADAVAENDELANRVSFIFPDEDTMSITDEFSGVVTAMVHGHQFGTGVNGWKTWWDGQCAGRTPVGDADLLLSAHRHHLRIQDYGGSRLWIQQPSLDMGSSWWTERKGDQSPARMISFIAIDGRIVELDPVL